MYRSLAEIVCLSLTACTTANATDRLSVGTNQLSSQHVCNRGGFFCLQILHIHE
jgi:hypothetical protein